MNLAYDHNMYIVTSFVSIEIIRLKDRDTENIFIHNLLEFA